ncbi:FecR domain-containing protein [Cellulophaga sp. 20_2_10]|uniref:FecR family protein n=1 Tax=Cellulophaga sp. 20_2_10 TaxID=2942476 RepID=UPI00201B34CF|nr:FecR family protein [Cellulophaga sp. 20_2_10]MCL5246052.1 FecR domain-containing protein [Cellulophaga sp. 20_2_10]
MPKSENIEIIITKYLSKSSTEKDLDELLDALKEESNKELFKSYVKANYIVDYCMKDFQTEKEKEKLLQLIKNSNKGLKRKKYSTLLKYAAVFIVFASLGSFYLFKANTSVAKNEPIEVVATEHIITPGTEKAILTLEDGTDVVLQKDSIYANGSARSSKNKLVYTTNNIKPSTAIEYNYLTVPRGGQYFVKLSDGTEVWLNSQSQLKYPKRFIEGKVRKVELVYGEAYFDVSPSTKHLGSKFKVLSKYQEVEVLGTEFNIKAYTDEDTVYTTLVEGKVALTANASQDILKPDEQVAFNIDTKSYSKNIVDVYDVTSWKNGVFSFKSKPLEEITRVLSRWYNVDFKFTNVEVKNAKFMGVLSKDQPLEDILLAIKNSGFITSYEMNNTSITLN